MKDEILYTDPVLKIRYSQRGSDTIHAYFSHKGKRYRFSTQTSNLPKAIQFTTKKYEDVNEGRDTKAKTLSQVYSEYIEFKRIDGLKDTTLADYDLTMRFVFEFFGKKRDIATISKKDIGDLVIWRRNYYVDQERKRQRYRRDGSLTNGKTYKREVISNRSVNKAVGQLLSVLRFACHEREYIGSDKIPSFKRLPENIRQEFIDEDELGLLFTHFIDKKMEYHALAVLFCFHTGCRYPGEFNKLKWKHIDFDQKAILFMDRKSKGKKIVNTRFPMLPILKELLEDMEEWFPDHSEDDYVFRKKSGTQVKTIRKAFIGAINACGLNDKIKSMYGLRHSFATHWIHTKMPLSGIAHLMGHADTTMLERRYAHLVSDKVNDHFQDVYNEMNKPDELSLIGKTKQHTLFEEDSLEHYRNKIRDNKE